LSDAQERNDIAIIISGNGKSVRLGSPSKWRRAIQLGDLSPDTPVEVISAGVARHSSARDVPELQALFESLGIHLARDVPDTERDSVERSGDGSWQASSAQPPWGTPSGEADSEPPSQAQTAGSEALGSVISVDEPATPLTGARAPASAIPLGILIIVTVVVFVFGLLTANNTGPKEAATTIEVASPALVAPNEILDLGKIVSWDSTKDPVQKSYQYGDLTLTLSSRSMSDGKTVPILTITSATTVAVEVLGAARMGDAAAEIGVFQLESPGSVPQIYFSSFTGGAHCCTEGKLVIRSGVTFSTVQLGAWDYGIKFEDLNADGVFEIIVSDERFLYAFAPYAGSVAPPKILKYQAGEITDVSTAFPSLFRVAMESARQGCLNRENGACAAYVANAARVEQFQSAWDTMLSHYNPDDDWQYPIGCSVETSGGQCPVGSEIRYSNYPDALLAFLTEAGYVQPTTDNLVLGPSFDCAQASSENLKLICTTPALAAADVRLAAAYSQALARSADPVGLRRKQLEWISARNNGPADIRLMLEMYAARISELSSPTNQ
jgi:uncharacterized protein YecT (DUF1311 family)